ncbi:MAG: rhomboid family intramembrane serine protease [Bacteroidales bacterium]
MRNISPTVKIIIILNISLLVLTMLAERVGINLTQVLGLYYPTSQHFHPYQFITHLFMHGGLMHLFFNMYALFIFGTTLEQVWGQKRFLTYYFVTGLGAALLHTTVNWIELSQVHQAAQGVLNTLTPDAFSTFVAENFIGKVNTDLIDKFVQAWDYDPQSPILMAQAESYVRQLLNMLVDIPTVGASGAVFGVLLAFGMLFPNTQLMLLIPPMPIKAKYFVMIYAGLELFLGFQNPGSNIAHFAHIGGMLFGFFLIRYWQRRNTHFF